MTTKPRAAEAAPVTPNVPDPTSTGADEWSNWRYLGEHRLTYAGIPVTVALGDVIAHPGPPADDGRWEPTDAEVTRHRDNHQEG